MTVVTYVGVTVVAWMWQNRRNKKFSIIILTFPIKRKLTFHISLYWYTLPYDISITPDPPLPVGKSKYQKCSNAHSILLHLYKRGSWKASGWWWAIIDWVSATDMQERAETWTKNDGNDGEHNATKHGYNYVELASVKLDLPSHYLIHQTGVWQHVFLLIENILFFI